MRALLLNASYEPLKVVSWQKALILWFQDKVEILEYHTHFAKSARAQFQLPSVLRLRSYVRIKNLNRVRFSRENVYIRDNFTCQYCGQKYHPKDLTLDHVIPASKSGLKNWSNVVSACRKCNQKKANRTPLGAGMPLLNQPVAPTWLPTPELDPLRNSLPKAWLVYLDY